MLLAAEPGTLTLILVVVVGLILLVRHLANRGTRPLVIGLGVIIGVGFLALLSFKSYRLQQFDRASWQAEAMARASQQRMEALARENQQRAEVFARDAQQRSQAIAQSVQPGEFGVPEPAAAAPSPISRHSYGGQLTAEVKAPRGMQSGTLRIGYQLFDKQARDCSIDVTYSPDRGKTWRPATEAAGGSGISVLNSSEWGSSHQFLWDSLSDLGAVRNQNVQIRVEPISSFIGSDRSHGAGTPGTSTFFVVDNRRLASQASKTSAASPPAAAQKADLVAALSDAVVQAWTSSGSASRTIAASKTSKLAGSHPLPLSQRERGVSSPARREDVTTQPPAWVNATPQQLGDVLLDDRTCRSLHNTSGVPARIAQSPASGRGRICWSAPGP